MPADGLTTQEALKRLRLHGRNELPRKRPPSAIVVFLRQFFSPLLLVLIAAGILTLIIGENLDAIVIFAAVFLNAIFGFIQEFRAVRTLHMLSQVLTSYTYVLRDGEQVQVDVTELVPGDLVMLEHGQRVPADGVVVEAQDLHINEAVLTGESEAVVKTAATEPPALQNVFEEFSFQKDLTHSVYMGTTVAGGFGVMLVIHTASTTAMGKLAKRLSSIKQRQTPLQKKLSRVSFLLTLMILGIVVVVMVIGVAKGYELKSLMLIAVALAVSAIPEGLSLVLTNILSVAMQRIFKKHGLVRSLIAAETLGSVDVICTDKTGTLTYGELKLVDVIAKADDKPLMYRALAVAVDLRDPLEHEIKRWIEKKGLGFESMRKRHPRVASLPFTLETRFTAAQTARHIYAFGAPEVLMKRSTLTDKQQLTVLRELEEFGNKGYRLIAVGGKEKRAGVKLSPNEVNNLTWYGFIVFRDLERRDVNASIKSAKAAGVAVKVITGDFPQTAKGLLERIGWYVHDEHICTGEQLEKITNAKERRGLVERSEIFARVTPQQKLLIVQTLQEAGHVVGMMGDGVNDALALKTADISIVTRRSSDVAKEIADLVLLNNTFSTVVAAIEEGRLIHAQIRRVLVYLLSGSFTEVVLVFTSILFGLPVPLTAVQILWINILTDGPPSFALIFEGKNPDAMRHGPTVKDEPLLPLPIAIFAGLVSLVTGTVAFGLYLYYVGANLEHAQTLVFLLVLIFSLVYVFSVRTLLEPIWKISIWSNKILVLTCGATLAFQAWCVFNPVTRTMLGIRMVTPKELMILGGMSLLVLVAVEAIKSAVRTIHPYQALERTE